MARLGDRHVRDQHINDMLACGADFVLQGNALRRICDRLGISPHSAKYYFSSENDLIRGLCRRHLDEAFEAVCMPTDWHGPPVEVLRAMGLALLAYLQKNAARHLVYLHYRHRLDEPSRNANDTLRMYLTNNFQLALQAVLPEAAFGTLLSPAGMLLGQMMQLPLWWPEAPHLSQDAWLCWQIGHRAGLAPPDWQIPPVERPGDAQGAWDYASFSGPVCA